MSTSGKTPAPDRRNRPARVSPRRHVHPSEQSTAGTYDGAEFPVLLRMPDISRPVAVAAKIRVDTPDSAVDADVAEMDATEQRPAERPSRHKRSSSGSEEVKWDRPPEKRSTGTAANRF